MMRAAVVVTVLLAGAGLGSLAAAPRETSGTAMPPPLAEEEARGAAEALVQVADTVARRYVRPIARSRLLYGMLAGLYEEIQQPVPDDLAQRLEEAMRATGPDVDADPPRDHDPIRSPQPLTPIVRVVMTHLQHLGRWDALRGQGLVVAVRGMIRMLDPYSKLLEGPELRRSIDDDPHQGLGLELAEDEIAGPLRIKTVVPGSPAQRAGLRPGDRITHIDNRPVDGANRDLLFVRKTLHGDEDQANRKVQLTVLPSSGKVARTFVLEHQVFQPEMVFGVRRNDDESWNFVLDGEHKIGYVRLGALELGTAHQLQQALVRLQADGMRGLILDLRWSPIGFLDEAVAVAELFLSNGTITAVKSRNLDEERVYQVRRASPWDQLPMIVLINGETSGAAELIAAALQDNRRAKIAGQRSFGKASVQTRVELPMADTALRLTTGNFLRPNGKALHRFPDSQPRDAWGVRPDDGLHWPISPDLSQQLQREWLLYTLRPSRHNEVLSLDDPQRDPQRYAALQTLIHMLR